MKPRTGWLTGLIPDAAPEPLHQSPGYSEPETGALDAVRAGSPSKPLEQLRYQLIRNTVAVVGDRHHHPVGITVRLQADSAATVAIRVGEQIDKDLLQAARVGVPTGTRGYSARRTCQVAMERPRVSSRRCRQD